MAQDPDVIEREIERSRAQLAETIDAIVDRVSPRRVALRAADKATTAVENAREGVLSQVRALTGSGSGGTTGKSVATTDWSSGRTDWTGVGSGRSGRTAKTAGLNARLGAAVSEARQLAAQGRSMLVSGGTPPSRRR